MSGKEGGKSHRTTQPASVPGAVSVPAAEEPIREARAPAPAPPRDSNPPPASNAHTGKIRRIAAPATTPGAVSIPGAQTVANSGESQNAMAMRKNPGGRFGRRGRGNHDTAKSAKKNGDAAATSIPGAHAVADSSESQNAIAMRKNPGGRTARRGRGNHNTTMTAKKDADAAAATSVPGAKAVANSGESQTAMAVLKNLGGRFGHRRRGNHDTTRTSKDTTDDTAPSIPGAQSVVNSGESQNAMSTRKNPGGRFGRHGRGNPDAARFAKKNADATATFILGGKTTVVNSSESQNVMAMRKNPGGRTGRCNRDTVTMATTVTAATGAASNSAVGEDVEYLRTLENEVKEAEHDLLGTNGDDTNTFYDFNKPAFEGDEEEASFIVFEDETLAVSAATAPYTAQQPTVITTADYDTGLAIDVMPGSIDGYTGPGHRAGDDDQLVIANFVEDGDGIDHNMGLPIGVEYDPDFQPSILKNVRFRFYATAILLLFIIIVIAAVLGAVVFKPESPPRPTFSPTEAPSNAPSSSDARKYREALLPLVGPNVNVEGTPQDSAARWIIEEDPMELALDSPFLAQRYLLALFYFSTTNNGANPWRSCNPPAPDSVETECDFLRIVFNSDDSIGYAPEPSTRWLSNTHECEWVGNVCGNTKTTHALKLIGQNITGTLPTELSSFAALHSIALTYNEFTGTLPSEYAGMRTLLKLEVQGNHLSGEIPDEYFQATSLQSLNLGDNMFSGTLSTKIGQLTNLRGFHSFQNMFTGTVPTEIANLRFLSFSRNHDNMFQGTIPTVLGELTLLREFRMDGNQFVGTLPSEIGRMSDMVDLRFHQNQLTGTIPEEYYSLVFLKRLALFGNYLTGTLSTQIGQWGKMEELQVSRNQLTGTIPTEIALMPKLRVAWLHLNLMVGSMPTEVCALRPKPLDYLQADCHPEGNEPNACSCCSACCNRETEICTILDDNA